MAKCPIEDCSVVRRPNQVMCNTHWAMLPRELQQAVVDGYLLGPLSLEHRLAVKEAIKTVRLKVESAREPTLF